MTTTEDLAKLTTAELESRRVEMLRLSASEADAAGRQAVLAEIRRRESAGSAEAAAQLPEVEKRLQVARARWTKTLDAHLDATRDLAGVIGERSNVRGRARGEPPSWGHEQRRLLDEATSAIANAIRPGML